MTYDEAWERGLASLEERLRVFFYDKTLLGLVFTHESSRDSTEKGRRTRQKLEFLGDGVLELVIRYFIFMNYPAFTVGQANTAAQRMLQNRVFARICTKIRLISHLRVG